MNPAITDAAPLANLRTATPVEIDFRAARLDHEYTQLGNTITALLGKVHSRNGERAIYQGRGGGKSWPTTDEQAEADVRAKLAEMTPSDREQAEHVLIWLDTARAAREANRVEADAIEAEYNRRPWARYIRVEGGHVHSGYWCQGGTIRVTTVRCWAPQLSGRSVDAAIAELQTTMCTHCFPSAPVVAVVPDTDECPGSRTYYNSSLPHRTGYYSGNWATCPDCQEQITVTKSAKLRTHKRR